MRMSQVLQRLRAEQAQPRAAPAADGALRVVPARDRRDTPRCRSARASRRSSTPATSVAPSAARCSTSRSRAPNPTGSFKDRGMVVAVAKALEEGARAIICASTGNTSASAAAYGAAAGLEVVVVLPRGQDRGRQAAPGAGGRARGSSPSTAASTTRCAIVRELAEDPGSRRTRSRSSTRSTRTGSTGQKTAAFEVCEDLGGAPDYLAIPVGNAGNISAYWMGFTEYRDAGLVETRPGMLGFQAEGAAPLVLGHPVDDPQTVATAIRIGAPGERRHGAARPRRVGRPHRRRHRRGDPRRVPRPRALRGHLLRAGQRRVGGGRAQARRRAVAIDPGATIVVRADRARAQGPRHRAATLARPALDGGADAWRACGGARLVSALPARTPRGAGGLVRSIGHRRGACDDARTWAPASTRWRSRSTWSTPVDRRGRRRVGAAASTLAVDGRGRRRAPSRRVEPLRRPALRAGPRELGLDPARVRAGASTMRQRDPAVAGPRLVRVGDGRGPGRGRCPARRRRSTPDRALVLACRRGGPRRQRGRRAAGGVRGREPRGR